jgi:hypothetical protein
VFVVAGLFSVVYMLMFDAIRPGSGWPHMANLSDGLANFAAGGAIGSYLAVGGILVLSVASWMQPSLFEGRIHRIILWASMAVLVLFACIAVDAATSDVCMPGGIGMVLGFLIVILLAIGLVVTTKGRLSGHAKVDSSSGQTGASG